MTHVASGTYYVYISRYSSNGHLERMTPIDLMYECSCIFRPTMTFNCQCKGAAMFPESEGQVLRHTAVYSPDTCSLVRRTLFCRHTLSINWYFLRDPLTSRMQPHSSRGLPLPFLDWQVLLFPVASIRLLCRQLRGVLRDSFLACQQPQQRWLTTVDSFEQFRLHQIGNMQHY
jgi:hypothetical protein